MATVKITKRDNFKTLRSIIENSSFENADQLLEFIDHELELLDKKNSKSGERKVNEKMENAKSAVLAFLSTVDKATVREVMGALDTDSSQFATAVLTALYAKGEGSIERGKDKGKSIYWLK